MNNAEVLVKFKGDNKELKTSTEESKKMLLKELLWQLQ